MADDPKQPPIKDEICTEIYETQKYGIINASDKVQNTSFQTVNNDPKVQIEIKKNMIDNSDEVIAISYSINSVNHPLPKSNDVGADHMAKVGSSAEDGILNSQGDAKHEEKSKKQESVVLTTDKHEYPCDMCQKEFDSYDAFQLHKKSHYEKLPCKICSESFSSAEDLLVHQKSHKGNQKCVVCGKKFKSIYNLKIHGRLHVGARPFACKSCGRKFTDQSNRNRHYIQIHTPDGDQSDKRYVEEFSSLVKTAGKFDYKFI